MDHFSYATTDDGVVLPVVDITNPSFACNFSEAELDSIAEINRQRMERAKKLPSFVLRFFAVRSVIMREILAADRGCLSGMATYLFKLGPDNLPRGFGNRLDRRLLRGIGPVACRLRLQEVARQLADCLVPQLGDGRGPLRLIDIAGGVAADAFNALILLMRECPSALIGRVIRIDVLDTDTHGPAFGARALAALRDEQAPLAGLDAELSLHNYDWSAPAELARIIANGEPDAIVAGTSEGGLFEYADDDTVRANLEALNEATPAEFRMVGTLVRDDSLTWLTHASGAPGTRPRGRQQFEALVGDSGWKVERWSSNPLYHVVTLEKRGAA